MLILFVGCLVLELLLFLPSIWRIRNPVAILLVPLISASAGALVISDTNTFTSLLVMLAVFRVINLLRVIQGRMHERYLYRSTRRTTMTLVGVSFITIFMAQFWRIDGTGLMTYLISLQLTVALVLLSVTGRNIYKSAAPAITQHYTDAELPSITIAIPARNETEDMAECLASLVANDYPKLEIIVLDDTSNDKTPDIIRSFAQSGVRFVRGLPEDEHWLAKNRAYQRLLEEASGAYILFCGVDTRFEPGALRSMVTTAKNRNKIMISIMPQRRGGSWKTAIFQPMRYWWELALPRRLFNRPAVLSSCWLIERKRLEKLGGFESSSRSIVPEALLAREIVKSDGYSFLRSNNNLGVFTQKSVENQFQTALRVRYPQLHRRPELALIVFVLESVFLALPFILLFISSITHHLFPATLATCLLILSVHIIIAYASDKKHTAIATLLYPVAILGELVVTLLSMWRYEFGTVEWKGRDIIAPAMHVIPKLPSID